MKAEKNKSIILRKVLIIIIVLLLGYFGYRNNIKYKKFDFGVKKDHYLLQSFYDEFPGKEVVKCKLGDVSGNGKDDLIIIFRKTKEANHLVVAIDSGKEIYFSEESSAPFENQKIEIKGLAKDNEKAMYLKEKLKTFNPSISLDKKDAIYFIISMEE